MLSCALAVALYVVNLGYGFTGSLQRLDRFKFQSRLLGGDPTREPRSAGNRWTGAWLASVPVPVPRDYLLGIDQQRTDFEVGDRCYLRGEWKQGGWRCFYLRAFVVKTPLGTLALLTASVLTWLGSRGGTRARRGGNGARSIASGSPRAPWRDDLCVLLPPFAIFALASSQTNYTNHFRYVLPAFPFLFIWVGRVAALVWPRSSVVGFSRFSPVHALSVSIRVHLWLNSAGNAV